MDGQFCCYPVTGACCTGAGLGTPLECLETDRDDCAARGGVYAGDGSLCEEDLEAQCIPLAVTMESMSAAQTSKGVQLRWTTASEVDTVGFRLLRQTADARKSAPVIVADMIPSAGNSLGGASYGFLDNNKEAWRATRYYIEDIDIHGKVTRHGPIDVIRGSRKPGAAEARGNL